MVQGPVRDGWRRYQRRSLSPLPKPAPGSAPTPTEGLDPTPRDHREAGPDATACRNASSRSRDHSISSGGTRAQPSADPATGQPHVTITAEADADGMAIAVITDRAGLDRLIAYLTGARDQWQAAA